MNKSQKITSAFGLAALGMLASGCSLTDAEDRVSNFETCVAEHSPENISQTFRYVSNDNNHFLMHYGTEEAPDLVRITHDHLRPGNDTLEKLSDTPQAQNTSNALKVCVKHLRKFRAP